MTKTSAKNAAPQASGSAEEAPHERRYEGADGISVLLPKDRAGGFIRVGDMAPGIVYRVQPQTAVRLVQVKRFEYATAADAKAGAAFIDKSNADALATPPPARDTGEGAGSSVTRDEE